jgi:hypothetical protein
MFAFSFWWKVPKGYMALELIFVSARTIKRHHHHPGIGLAWQEYTFADVAGGPDFGAPGSECARSAAEEAAEYDRGDS